jgi:hypothetical protein
MIFEHKQRRESTPRKTCQCRSSKHRFRLMSGESQWSKEFLRFYRWFQAHQVFLAFGFHLRSGGLFQIRGISHVSPLLMTPGHLHSLHSIATRNCHELRNIHFVGVVSSRFIFHLPLKFFVTSRFGGASHLRQLHSIATRDCRELRSMHFVGVLFSRFIFLHQLVFFAKSPFGGVSHLRPLHSNAVRNYHELSPRHFVRVPSFRFIFLHPLKFFVMRAFRRV